MITNPIPPRPEDFKRGNGNPLYQRWWNMRDRCKNPSYHSYHRYGGRGISICPEWMDFETFLRDTGLPPEGCSLDRIDNDKGYYPENVKWSTSKEQCRNRHSNRLIETRPGHLIPLPQLAEEFGIDCDALRMRLNRGWPVLHALLHPVRPLTPSSK